MAYDYDVDILAALWTGAEDGAEPYASFLADNPNLTSEVSELRILSTIELLRSHIELIASRNEAKLLHESISKMITHTAGGSNPFSSTASISSAIGNVKQPQFAAGASIDLIIGGTTTSHTSATGGSIDTVISELNATLDGTSLAEVTEIQTLGDVDGNRGGLFFTINSANDATNYYVWMSHSGRIEVTNIGPVADVEGSLGGTHFTINSAGDATNYYVWMSHSGRAESFTIDFTGVTGATLPTGAVPAAFFDADSTTTSYRFWFDDTSTTPPAAGGRTLVAVPFTGTDTDQDISDSVVTALVGADVDFAGADNAGGTTPLISATLATVGSVPDVTDGAVATGAVFAVTTQGIDVAVDPAPGGLTGITVSYSLDDAAAEIGTAIASAIGGNPDFATEGTTPVVVTNAAVGDTTDAEDVDTEFAVETATQGLDVAVDPAPVGLTGIAVSYSVGESATEIRDAIVTDVGANADFATESSGIDVVVITNAATGPATDATAGDSEFGVTVTQQGIIDSIGVQAFKTADGRLGFRSQIPFLSFSLSNGTGGIIGPAGIIPGERPSTPKRVADEGRDNALNHVKGPSLT